MISLTSSCAFCALRRRVSYIAAVAAKPSDSFRRTRAGAPARLLRLDAHRLDQLAEPLGFRAHVLAELLGRAPHAHAAARRDAFLHRGRRQRLVDLGVETQHDVARDALRNRKARPAAELVARKPRLVE